MGEEDWLRFGPFLLTYCGNENNLLTISHHKSSCVLMYAFQSEEIGYFNKHLYGLTCALWTFQLHKLAFIVCHISLNKHLKWQTVSLLLIYHKTYHSCHFNRSFAYTVSCSSTFWKPKRPNHIICFYFCNQKNWAVHTRSAKWNLIAYVAYSLQQNVLIMTFLWQKFAVKLRMYEIIFLTHFLLTASTTYGTHGEYSLCRLLTDRLHIVAKL